MFSKYIYTEPHRDIKTLTHLIQYQMVPIKAGFRIDNQIKIKLCKCDERDKISLK